MLNEDNKLIYDEEIKAQAEWYFAWFSLLWMILFLSILLY